MGGSDGRGLTLVGHLFQCGNAFEHGGCQKIGPESLFQSHFSSQWIGYAVMGRAAFYGLSGYHCHLDLIKGIGESQRIPGELCATRIRQIFSFARAGQGKNRHDGLSRNENHRVGEMSRDSGRGDVTNHTDRFFDIGVVHVIVCDHSHRGRINSVGEHRTVLQAFGELRCVHSSG